jgi:hypothetical protein
MNGNYEFVRQMAQDKQYAFNNQAQEHRLIKQAGRVGGLRQATALVAKAGKWTKDAALGLAGQATGQAANWKASLHRPGTATQ